MYTLFYEILQIALGEKDKLSRCPLEEEWKDILYFSGKQAITGVVYKALDKLSKQGVKPPLPLLLEWIALYESIKNKNLLLNRRCGEITKLFKGVGYRSCILKGQGNALMYPDPLSRQPGDIDIWVDASPKEIIQYVNSFSGERANKLSKHHIDFPIYEDVDVEVHFIPTYSETWRVQRKLNRFVDNNRKSQFENPTVLGDYIINTPTDYFNVILQLSHMQRHFFRCGIGLRHILDFYYLIKSCYNSSVFNNITDILKELGLLNFSKAIMWVLKNKINLNDKYIFITPDEARGILLFDEINRGGGIWEDMIIDCQRD